MTTQEQSSEFPKKVMLVIHSMRGGGSERQMSYLANELSGRSQTTLVTLDQVGDDRYPLNPRIHRIGLNLVSSQGGLFRGFFANVQRALALRKAIRMENPDVVISFCDSNNILTLMATPSKTPVLISERSDPRRQKLSRVWESLRKVAYPRAMVCVAQTDSVAEYLASTKLVSKSRIRVIPSAIRIPEMDLQHTDSKRIKNQNKTLIYVGRLSREKRVDRLISVWAKLSIQHPSWELKIVGDGPELSALQELATHWNIQSSIQWARWSDDVWAELSTAHAYCLVSEYEGFPQSMLEAMASGLPIAVMDYSPAIRQTVADGVNGLIIQTEVQIGHVLHRLLESESLRMELGRHAADRARDFDWNRIAPMWLETIRSMQR